LCLLKKWEHPQYALIPESLLAPSTGAFYRRLLPVPSTGAFAGAFAGTLAGAFAGAFTGTLAGAFAGTLAGTFSFSLALCYWVSK